MTRCEVDAARTRPSADRLVTRNRCSSDRILPIRTRELGQGFLATYDVSLRNDDGRVIVWNAKEPSIRNGNWEHDDD